jgi:hypothetical protein
VSVSIHQDRVFAAKAGEKERAGLLGPDDGKRWPSQHDAGMEDIVSFKQATDWRFRKPITFFGFSAPEWRI